MQMLCDSLWACVAHWQQITCHIFPLVQSLALDLLEDGKPPEISEELKAGLKSSSVVGCSRKKDVGCIWLTEKPEKLL